MAKKKKNLENYPFGICMVSVAPIRRKPDDRAEIISQMLFGEQVKLIKKKGKNWLYVMCTWDDYEGWIDPKQIIRITETDSVKLAQNPHYALETEQVILSDNRSQSILLGSTLPDFDGISFKFPGKKYVYYGQVINPASTKISREIFIKIIRKYLYAPYLWGGRSPFGLDCSGYTQMVYRMCGISLPRDSSEQVSSGELVSFVEEAQLGDLAFFENKDGQIIHVGIVLDEGKIIHASGQIRIDKLDHHGIYNLEIKKYSHKLRVIKRLMHLETAQNPTTPPSTEPV